MRRLAALFARHPALGALSSLAMKVGGSLSALVMFALAARTASVADFGLLVIVFNAVSFLAVLAVLGQDTLILRSWGEFFRQSPGHARGAVIFGLRVAGLGAVVAASGFVGWAAVIDGRLAPLDLAAVAAFLFTQTLLHYASSLTRAVRGVFHSEPNRELTWRLPMVAVLAYAVATGAKTTIAGFFAVAAAGQIVALLFQMIAVGRGMPDSIRQAEAIIETTVWARRSAAMSSAAMAEAANQYADVVLIGALAGPVASAGYFVALRIASVFPMLTAGLHNYSASRIAELHFSGRTAELQKLMNRVMAVALVLVSLLLGLITVAGPWLLGLFGASYRSEYPILMVLASVSAFATLAGPGGVMMLTMGRERLYLGLILASLAIRVTALVVLVPSMGILGAAIAVGLAVAPFVAVVTRVCVRDLGVDPSILACLRRSPAQ